MNETIEPVDIQIADIASIEQSSFVITGDEENVDYVRECTQSESSCDKLSSNKRDVVKVLKTKYNCPDCEITFSRQFSFRRHVTRKHPNLLDELFPPVQKLKCDLCDKSFKCMASVKTHRRRHHNLYLITKTHKCPLCREEFERKNGNKHFESKHNLILEKERLEFNNYDEFCEWKKSIEKETSSYFAKQTTQTSNGTSHHFFICHRSGTYRPRVGEKKRKLKAKGSRKIDGYCPATIKVTQVKGGLCHVAFQAQHIGHENEIKHLNLTLEERKHIAEMLESGLSIDVILNDIRNSVTENSSQRLLLITKKDLYNIRASFLKDKHPHTPPPDIISTESLSNILEEIKKEHSECQHMKADVTNLENGWMLNLTEDNEICFIKENRSMCDCAFICSDCKACVHSYECNCVDFSDEPKMCRHIHFLCMLRNTGQVNVLDENDSLNCDDMIEISNNIDQDDCLDDVNAFVIPNEQFNSDVTYGQTPKKDSLSRTSDSQEILLEKKNNLKKKISDLIDSITNDEQCELLENNFLELSAKLEAVKSTNGGVTTSVCNHSSDSVSTDTNLSKQSNPDTEIIYKPIVYQIPNSVSPDNSRIYILNFTKVNNS